MVVQGYSRSQKKEEYLVQSVVLQMLTRTSRNDISATFVAFSVTTSLN